MIAVRLGIVCNEVAVFVGQNFPQVQEGTALFQRNGRKLVVDLAQPLFVQAGSPLFHLRPHRRDGLDVNFRVGQCLRYHVQHQPVIGEEAGIVVVSREHIGAQQDVERPGLLGSQRLHGDLFFAVCPAAGGVVDHRVGAHALVGTVVCVGQAGGVHLHPLGQAVAQKAHVGKRAPLHDGAGRLSGKPEIHGGGAVVHQLDAQAAGRRVADGVPLASGQLLLQNGGALGGRGRFAVETLPEDAHSGQQHQKDEQRSGDEHPAPAPMKDAAAVFLIISHSALLKCRSCSPLLYSSAPARATRRGKIPISMGSALAFPAPDMIY